MKKKPIKYVGIWSGKFGPQAPRKVNGKITVNPKYEDPRSLSKFRWKYGNTSLGDDVLGTFIKINAICPNYKCHYHSRIPHGLVPIRVERNINHSTHCPHHNVPLINVGCGDKIPKAGSRKRKWLCEAYAHAKTAPQ